MLATDLRQSITFPAPLEDVGAMVEWVVDHAEEYGLDLSNLFFVGDSAGAHLATAYTAVQLNEAYANSSLGLKWMHYSFQKACC